LRGSGGFAPPSLADLKKQQTSYEQSVAIDMRKNFGLPLKADC